MRLLKNKYSSRNIKKKQSLDVWLKNPKWKDIYVIFMSGPNVSLFAFAFFFSAAVRLADSRPKRIPITQLKSFSETVSPNVVETIFQIYLIENERQFLSVLMLKSFMTFKRILKSRFPFDFHSFILILIKIGVICIKILKQRGF